MHLTKQLKFQATQSSREVSAILIKPSNAKMFLVFAHGAGAGMQHPFMENVSKLLADNKVATFRFQFPYMEKKIKHPDIPNILMETVRSAVNAAKNEVGDLPLFAGGKSLGGRMTSNAAAKSPFPNVKGIIFFGFPLHAPGKPSSERAEHLYNVTVPMLFLQGTRDSLADFNLLKPLCKKLGEKAELHIIEGADHSFHVLKSSGKDDKSVLKELAEKVSIWGEEFLNKT